MQTAEIITRLWGFAWSMTMAADLAPVAFDAEDAAVINAAIAALDPVPITEAGLREAGFVAVRRGASYTRDLAGNHCFACLWWWKDGGVAVELADGDCYDLHITSMQRLREVIAAIEGDADAG